MQSPTEYRRVQILFEIYIFSGNLFVETGIVSWIDLLATEDVNTLVKELYGNSIEGLTFFDNAVTVKEIYGSKWTGKEIKELYFE